MKKAFSLIELSIVILIIGILIAGVTQSSRLVTQFRLSSARSLTQNSPVGSISDLALWLETTSEASFASNIEDGVNINSPTYVWNDINPQSSQKYTASSAAGPKYKEKCINDLPCLYFDGSAQFLDVAQIGGSYSQMSVFVVYNNLVLTSMFANQYMFAVATSGVGVTSPMQIYTGGGLQFMYTSAAGGGVGFGYAFGVVANNNAMVDVIDKGSTQSWAYSLPGVPLSTNTPGSGSGAKNINSGVNIGSFYNGSARSGYFNGYIGEVIVFTRGLKNEERRAVESYLSKKWGIKI